MDLIIVLLRLALSVVFAVAGATKLLDQSGTRAAVKNFGSPEAAVAALSYILPLAELAIAAGLLFIATFRAGALGALLRRALGTVGRAGAGLGRHGRRRETGFGGEPGQPGSFDARTRVIRECVVPGQEGRTTEKLSRLSRDL